MGRDVNVNGLPVPVEDSDRVIDLRRKATIPGGLAVMVRDAAGARSLRDDEALPEADVFTLPNFVYGG